MYHQLKKIFRFIIPEQILFKIEPFFRSVFSLTKKGNNHQCNICNFKLKDWIILKNNDKLCPKCGSLSRDRRLWQIIESNYIKQNIHILDFSPSRCLYRKWSKLTNIKYIATDLSNNFIAKYKYDITNIPVDDHTFDLIICYHILEHILDDKKAIQELFRVLKPNGKIIIQTPFKYGNIYEDFNIISETERLKHFGQADHVRIYSVTSLVKRLNETGFKTNVLELKNDDFNGFKENEKIILANN